MTVTLTIDLEDVSGRYEAAGRYVSLTRHLLSLCDEHRCKATFFVVGKLAEASPLIIREISAQGHEIASHSHAHCPLTQDTRESVARTLREDKDRLEQLTGQAVVGYRAPCFSLRPETRWVVDALAEAGFLYSSSVMPTTISRHGYPQAPATAFRWPNGLVEFPLPTYEIGGLRLPYLGGIYLYAWPFFLSSRWARKARSGSVLWTYAHPYDFDRAEPWGRMPDTPLWASAILRLARRVAERKIRGLLTVCGIAPPLKDRLLEREYPAWIAASGAIYTTI
ncbi:MAG: polysaccharide deacetylase family protein [Bdellovibrionales bacterium]